MDAGASGPLRRRSLALAQGGLVLWSIRVVFARSMSFGRNPHVAKAEAAEQKARSPKDSEAARQAWREAARYWDRAGDRETDEKRKLQYAERADAARAEADGTGTDGVGADAARTDGAGTDGAGTDGAGLAGAGLAGAGTDGAGVAGDRVGRSGQPKPKVRSLLN
jgi:hypothetical protein